MRIIRTSQLLVIWLVLVTAAQQHASDRQDSHHRHNILLKDVPVVVTVNLQQSLNTITDHFIGHSLGNPTATQLSHHFRSEKLKNLARALSPLWARMGGSFVHGPEHNIKVTHWEAFPTFFKEVGWDMILILDVKPRKMDGSWNHDAARALLHYSNEKNHTIAGFELGNEYNLLWKTANMTLTPEQLAIDVLELQQLLGEFPKYYSSFIMGPDTAGDDAHYFQGFLAAGGHKVVRAATFHQYYFQGNHGNLSYFTDVETMDRLTRRVDHAITQTRSVDPLLPVWLSETGSASWGGAPGMSDRFASGFLWLDKLGLCAEKGIKAVIRHVFYGDTDHYGIIDRNIDPNTDFWLTVLYKRIVRGAVFHATGRHDVRVYAACANIDNFNAGSLAVYMLNPNNNPLTFDLPQFTQQPRFRYTLTAGDKQGLVSKYIALNGAKLQLVNDTLPPLKPDSAPRGLVTVPAYSYTFLVFPEARVSICLH